MVFTKVHHERIRGSIKGNLSWWLTLFVSALIVAAVSHRILAALPRPFNYRTEAVAALSKEIEILGLGSSHVYVMLDPDLYSPPLMNLSSDAFNYRVVESVLDAHIDRVPSLKLALIEWDFVPFVYDTIRAYRTDFRRFLDFSPALDSLDEPFAKLVRLHWDAWRHDSLLFGPFFQEHKLTPRAIRAAMKGSASGSDVDDRILKPGYTGLLSEMTRERMGDRRLAVHRREAVPGQIEANFQALQRIMRKLRQKKVKIAFVRFPHHKSYWSIQPKEWEEMLDRYLRQLRQEFGAKGFELWDLEREPGMENRDFFDADHLNVRGDRKLAPLLQKRIDAILAR